MAQPKHEEMSERMEEVYRYICKYMDEHTYSPSMRDIAEGCMMSRGNATRYVDKLESLGRLKRTAGIARSIILVED